jgi:HNH endonuclease
MSKKELPPGALERYQSGVPLYRVAAEFGISEPTLRRRLKEAGVTTRTNEKPLPMDLAEMCRLYEQEQVTAKDLAAMTGVALQTVQRRLASAGVHIRGPAEMTARTRERISRPGKIDKERLRELHAQGMSCREIAEAFGCTGEPVRRMMVRLGLPRLPAKARPERNHFWQGRNTHLYQVDEDGYILVKCPDHPYATKSGFVRQHRLVMEEQLGRYLLPEEVVDHKNRDTSDNDPGNLQLFASNADHLRDNMTGSKNLSPEEREARRQEAVRRAEQRVAAILAASGNGAQPSP